MSSARVTLEVTADEEEGGVEAVTDALWDAIRDAGIDANVTVVSVEPLPEEDE